MTKKFTQKNTSGTNALGCKITRTLTHAILNILWHLAPMMTKRFMKKQIYTTVRREPTAEEKFYLEKGGQFNIRVNNNRIQCWKWGHGPSVLFVHGLNGRGVRFHNFFGAFMNAGYSVITFDAPSHGESEGQFANYFDYTDTIRSFIKQRSRWNIDWIIGHSFGASAVINSISKENSGLGVVLISPVLKLREFMYEKFDYYGVPKVIYETIIGDFEKQFGYNFQRDNPYILLDHINKDLLIVHDINDSVAPYHDSKEASERLDNILFYSTEGYGHMRILTENSIRDYILNYIDCGWDTP